MIYSRPTLPSPPGGFQHRDVFWNTSNTNVLEVYIFDASTTTWISVPTNIDSVLVSRRFFINKQTLPPLAYGDIFLDVANHDVLVSDGVNWISVSVPAQSNTTQTTTFTPKVLLTITDSNGDMLVQIDTAGCIQYGPNYTPDAAAQIFWNSIGATTPTVITLKEIEALKLLNADLLKRLEQYEPSLSGASNKDPDAYDRAMKTIT